MLRVYVVHWDEADLRAKVQLVEAAGHHVVGAEWLDGKRALAQVREFRADTLVVWLTQLPSHGRTLAAAVRSYAWGRDLPILLVEGDPEPLAKEKRAKLAEVLPDGVLVPQANLGTWLGKVEAAIEARARPT